MVSSELTARENVGFFEAGSAHLFGCLHPPEGPARGAVLVCPPLHAEAIANYRKEVLLARGLAAAGLAALRFHYAGTGNSQGNARAVTFDSMLAGSGWSAS